MPNWLEVLEEIRSTKINNDNESPFDLVSYKYILKISEITDRNTISYYSGWLQKPNAPDTIINDKDKSGFMLTINKLDRTKGLDLILHTPGGDIAATESIVDYLYSMFNFDIRVIVPQISMSAGTMIALSSKEIVMGKQSNLGPIGPQIGGVPCQAVLDEFQAAKEDIRLNPHSALLWQEIIGKYHPTFINSCKQSIEWSEQMVKEWLKLNMCKDDITKVDSIINTFADHKIQKSHNRHISRSSCETAGVNVSYLEINQEFQDAVLSLHHAYLHTFSNTHTVKIIENQFGNSYMEYSQQL